MRRIAFFSILFTLLSLGPSIAFSETFEVIMYDYYFEPSSLTIHAGDTVVWIDKGTVSHTSVSGTKSIPDGKWYSGYLLPERMAPHKSTYKRVFNEPGTYPYFCEQHPQMDGIIIVNP